MDYTNSEFWIAILVGGSLIGAPSAGQQLYTKDPDYPLRTKPIVRDFCIGAFLTALAFMFLPESMHGLISAGTNAAQSITSAVKTQTGGSMEALEIRTGPARF